MKADTPAQMAYPPRALSASPAVIAAARLVRVHVLRATLKTMVVSIDRRSSITVLTPDELSVPVPDVAEMWIPFPPGHPGVAARPVSELAAIRVVGGVCPSATENAEASAMTRIR